MPTEAQGIRVLTAWEGLLEALEDGEYPELQVVRDLYLLCDAGGADVHQELFGAIHGRAEGLRQVLRRCEVEA